MDARWLRKTDAAGAPVLLFRQDAQEIALKALDSASSNNSTANNLNAHGESQSANHSQHASPNTVSNHCLHCQQDTKARRRDFSEQTWTVLMVWGEIDAKTVDQPICEPCYNELRYVLIDRADEIEVALGDHAAGIKPAAIKAGIAKPVATATKGKKSGKQAG